jgi:L-ascorbate metabolism protein UlaG (beta-lactamase superfamily)
MRRRPSYDPFMKPLALIPVSLVFAIACAKTSPAPLDTTSTPTPPPAPSSAPVSSVPVPPAPLASAPASAATPPDRPFDTIKTAKGELRIIPIHHGTVLFEIGGKAYYVDPFHEGNLSGLPKADVVFITHAHPDHLDPVALDQIRKPSTIVVAPPSVAEKLALGFAGTVIMKNGDKMTVADVGVEAVPMYNLKRGPSAGKLFHEKGWGDGFVLTIGDERIYLSGDTECTPETRALKNIDIAFVCMNLPYTMAPSEAAECIKAFKPKILYPYHYRGSDLAELDKGLAGQSGIEVRKRDWY